MDGLLIAVLLIALALFVLALALAYLLYPAYQTAKQPRVRPRVTRHTTSADKQKAVETEITLSVVIPAYNEELRLPIMLQEAQEYLSRPDCLALERMQTALQTGQGAQKQKQKSAIVEWILVDDGSKDQTGMQFLRYAKQQQQTQHEWTLLTLPRNCGKGAAVQAGMIHARGHFCLMVDADGATAFQKGLEALTKPMTHTPLSTIYLGSRDAHIQKDRTFIRRLLAACFRILIQFTLGSSCHIRDTQCGFKLFPQPAAQAIFTALHLQRWAFDIEVLYLAACRYSFQLQEIVVPWHEVDGSKLHTSTLNLAIVSLSMLRDIICVRMCYDVLGIWTAQEGKQNR